MATTDKMVEMYKSRYAALDLRRAALEPVNRDIRKYLAPYTARFKGEKAYDPEKRQDSEIINTVPRFAVRTLPSGLQSGMTNPLRPWFRFGLPDPDLQEFEPVKLWLSSSERRVREVLARSNIYDRLKSNYGMLGNYGTSCLFLDEDDEDVARATDFLMGTFMISSDAAGRVDTLYRDGVMTARQMIAKFKERAPHEARLAYDNGNYESEFHVCHIVEKNQNYRIGSALSQYKQWVSVWLDKNKTGNEAILKISGYDTQPFFAPRWDTVGEDPWGIGCGNVALGDARGLQLLEKRQYMLIDHETDPAMMADGTLRNSRNRILPGSITYVNGLMTGKPGFQRVFESRLQPQMLLEKSKEVEMHINEAYYKNLFTAVLDLGDQPNITATQINTLREERLMMLGPVLERLNDDLLDPLLNRLFSIMYNRGMLEPPPEEIQGMPLRVEYISVLAQAQKALGLGNIERFIGFVGSVAQFDTSVVDKMDTDEIIDEYADNLALPPKMVRTAEQVQSIRDGRAQQEQAAQMADSVGMTADAMKTLSETQMNTDSALNRAVGAVGGV
nr:tail protein [bacterium]